MTRPTITRLIFAIGVLGLAGLAPPATRVIVASQTPAPQQPRPIFRGGISLVPIDVSVVDRNGKPVTDLKQEDFTILEDKIPQEIKSFSANALVPEPPPPGVTPTLVRATEANRVTPQTHRTFLIVFGFGRIQEPTKVFDATIHFIRERLLPQDFVAVLGWDRATDLTTDHEQAAQLVERYKQQNDAITQEINDWMSHHRGEDLPASIQAHIDAVFEPPPTPGSAPPVHTGPHMRSATNMLLGTDAFQKRDSGSHSVPWNLIVATRPDLYKIYAGIEYLRYLDGEKHLIICTNGAQVLNHNGLIAAGLAGPSVQDDERLAARAGDARIVVDIIYTDGTPGFRGFPKTLSPTTPVSDPGFVFGAMSAERVAELTGGEFLGTHYAADTFAKVDQASRFGYLLGYAPTDPSLDDRFRKVTVKVNRKDVTVLFRHGYHAQEDLPPLDLPAMLTATRRAGAASYDRESHDIKVDATATVLSRVGLLNQVRVDVTIDPSRIAFTSVDGRHTAGLDITIYCGDVKEHVVGQVQYTMDLKLGDEAYQAALKDGIKYSARVPVSADANNVKAIVYDFGADLTGTAMLTIK